MSGDEDPRLANRRRLLHPSLWAGVAVLHAALLLTVGAGTGWPVRVVQLAGPVLLALAVRDLSIGRAREAMTGSEPWAAWLVSLCVLVASSLVGVIFLLATW